MHELLKKDAICYDLPNEEIIQQLSNENEELAEQIKDFEAEVQEVSNQLYDLYELCSDTTRPEVYGSILGLHERLDQALKDK